MGRRWKKIKNQIREIAMFSNSFLLLLILWKLPNHRRWFFEEIHEERAKKWRGNEKIKSEKLRQFLWFDFLFFFISSPFFCPLFKKLSNHRRWFFKKFIGVGSTMHSSPYKKYLPYSKVYLTSYLSVPSSISLIWFFIFFIAFPFFHSILEALMWPWPVNIKKIF